MSNCTRPQGKLHFISTRRPGKEFKKLYTEAFPAEERMPLFMLLCKANGTRAKFFTVFNGEMPVALLYNVYYRDIVYVFYFAVNNNLRGGGYGGRIMKTIRQKYKNRRLILAVEKPDENYENIAQRIKRLDFYKCCGFEQSGNSVKEGKVIYELLAHSENESRVDMKEYYELMKNYFGKGLFALYKIANR